MKKSILCLFLGVLSQFDAFSAQNNVILSNKIFTVTAYCNANGKGCTICNGKWAKYHKTANGSVPTEGITCAASRNIPFNTKLEIEGVGTRIVQDRLAKKYDDRIDIYFNSHKDALKFGKKQLKVKIVK